MMIRQKRHMAGFSLVEALAAGTILSLTVLGVIASSSRSVSITRSNRQYETAASLIERQLSMIDFMGIDEFIDAGRLEGDFEEYEPPYHWEVETEYLDVDSLYQVTIRVTWLDRKRPYSLTVDTMLNGESLAIETESETGEGADSQASSGGGGGSSLDSSGGGNSSFGGGSGGSPGGPSR